MSTPPPPSEASPAKLNKAELFSDLLAFASIVSAFLFLSYSLASNHLEAILGSSSRSGSEIALFYLLYSLLVVILKAIAGLVRWRKGEIEFTKEVEAVVNRSLFAVAAIVAIHIVSLPKEGDVAALCQISAWLLVAELNIIFCGLLRKVPAVESLSLFGWAIEGILVLGQVASLAGFDFFEVL